MKTRKSFAAPPPVEVVTDPQALLDDAASLVIPLPENPTCLRSLDLTPWLGRGIDAWVWACAGQIRAFLASKEVAPSSVASYSTLGLRWFFEFLTTVSGPADPSQLEPRHIRLYLEWLSKQGRAYGTQKVRYSNTKTVLIALTRRLVVPNQEGLFPVNPFPKSNSQRTTRAAPLSSGERVRLAQALREDLIAIHQGHFDEAGPNALVVHLLAVAIRTGANTSPLLEASRDSLRPHPFMPSMMRLELFKRRGNATKLLQLRYSKQDELALSVPMDGVALIRKVLQLSESLLLEAKPEHRNRVWLYRTDSRSSAPGQVAILTSKTLNHGIARLIKRHDLRTDDGEPLQLNLSRLRKTLEQRLFDLSGGDLITTAAVMGHSPTVADIHYLACTQQMRENATFVGEALPNIYRTGEDGKKVTSILPEQSPTGRCKAPYQGDKAPKNGEPCDDFFSCFACTSYAIVGSPEDLHRLFSFYFFLEREMHHARTEDWRSEFRHTMNLIDRFTADKFDPAMVATARERARIAPLKFWASYALREEIAHG